MNDPVLNLDAAEQAHSPIKSGIKDVIIGIKQYKLWSAMACLDIGQRYSRSILGPLWVTLSLAIFILGLGVVYAQIFRLQLSEYLPYLTVGIVVWTMLSTYLVDGCNTFTSSESLIKQMQVSLSIFIFRLVWRTLIVFAHNAIILFLVLIWFKINFLPGLPFAVIGIFLIYLNGLCFSTILGTVSARFRDIPPLMINIAQLCFFVTPVLWQTRTFGERHLLFDMNPLFHLIEIVRSPLLDLEIPTISWIFAIAFTLVHLIIALLFYARFRWRIPYWL